MLHLPYPFPASSSIHLGVTKVTIGVQDMISSLFCLDNCFSKVPVCGMTPPLTTAKPLSKGDVGNNVEVTWTSSELESYIAVLSCVALASHLSLPVPHCTYL